MTNIVRTSKGLVDALFESLDKLNSKEIDAEQARALSHTARTIVNVARLEIEFRKLSERSELKSLALEVR